MLGKGREAGRLSSQSPRINSVRAGTLKSGCGSLGGGDGVGRRVVSNMEIPPSCAHACSLPWKDKEGPSIRFWVHVKLSCWCL